MDRMDQGSSGSSVAQNSPAAASAMPVMPQSDEKFYRMTASPSASNYKDGSESREQRGWLPMKVDGRLHLLGWVRPAGAGEVRGVELELAALISRLGGTLPAEVSAEEGYALRDDQCRVLHQAGAGARAAAPAITLPLAGGPLPGWDGAGGGWWATRSISAGPSRAGRNRPWKNWTCARSWPGCSTPRRLGWPRPGWP